MISSQQLSIVKFIISAEDFLIPLDTFTRINLYKPEDTSYTKIGIIPNITMLTNGLIGFNFCLVILIDEDLPIGDVNLLYCGQYDLVIETSPDNITFNTVWKDIFTLVCDEIQYNYN